MGYTAQTQKSSANFAPGPAAPEVRLHRVHDRQEPRRPLTSRRMGAQSIHVKWYAATVSLEEDHVNHFPTHKENGASCRLYGFQIRPCQVLLQMLILTMVPVCRLLFAKRSLSGPPVMDEQKSTCRRKSYICYPYSSWGQAPIIRKPHATFMVVQDENSCPDSFLLMLVGEAGHCFWCEPSG